MFSLTRRIGAVAIVGLATLAFDVPRVFAQNPYFQVRPGLTLQQYTLLAQAANPYAALAPRAALVNNPYMGSLDAASMYSNPYSNPYSSPYTSWWYEDPYGAYLRGGAEVIGAQGRFMVNQQQAFSLREQVLQERVSTRRRIFDEWLYERERTPTPEEERERFMREQLRHSRNNPPATEIWSGKALNDLLADLKKQMSKGDTASLRTFDLSLEEDALKQINVSRGAGNIGILKNGGKLSYPLALSGSDFKEDREQLSSLVEDAVSQAKTNSRVDPGTIRDLNAAVEKIRKKLLKTGSDLPPSQYIEAKTFLNNLDEASTILKLRDVASYINGDYNIAAKSVPDLVKFMKDKGLQFAPAVPGGEGAYLALHQALVSYDLALQPR